MTTTTPTTAEPTSTSADALTPRRIVSELDRHIIGQAGAKRAVAVAVRNRWRRRQLDARLAAEVLPKNILLVGPTGVGKTEIARRLARLVQAPFVKVEASKYTEVGYHGRDVESMVRDLLDRAIAMVRDEQAAVVRTRAEEMAEQRLVSLLLGSSDDTRSDTGSDTSSTDSDQENAESGGSSADDDAALRERVRGRMLDRLRTGAFDEREIEIVVQEKPTMPMLGGMGPDQIDPSVGSMLESLMPDRQRRRRVTVERARSILIEEETDKLIDSSRLVDSAIERTERSGIIFIDEIDKVATGGEGRSGADVSRQGVQRDLLPIVEGSAVSTRHGIVHTDGILFVAAGAFHTSTVSDLMPELQGRFPIRVELEALTRADLRRILTEPDAALLTQQRALLGTEGIDLVFTEEAIDAMAELAAEANNRLENIGARRLMTVVECVTESLSFDAPDLAADGTSSFTVDDAMVRQRVGAVLQDEDLTRFVL